MDISTQTIIISLGHSITAIISMAMLIQVLLMGPRQRSNRIFAAMMILLAIHSLLNIVGRFLQPLNLDPWPLYTAIMTLYLGFVMLVYPFTAAFAGLRGPVVNRIIVTDLALSVFSLVCLYSGQALTELYALPGGGFNGTPGALYIPLGLIILAYLAYTTIALARSPNNRARRLWPAMALITAGYVSLALRPLIPLPLNAILLSAATLWMGYVVLQHEIFNPLAELNRELARTNVELAEANSLKNQFMANMSHELRTPLNSVIGYADLLLREVYGPITAQQQDRLERIAKNGRHLLDLINDILDLSKIESGHMPLNRTTIETAALLDSVLDTVAPLAERKAIMIKRDYAHSPSIYGDETRIRQVFFNLISNALKFTPEGTITVSVAADLDGGMVAGYVQDTGIGIPEEKQAIVFEAFRQSDQSPTRAFEGTGLGLTISRHFVEMHGGRLWLESTLDEGTTFHFRLPSKLHATFQLSYPHQNQQDTLHFLEPDALLDTIKRLTVQEKAPVLVIDGAPDSRESGQIYTILARTDLKVVTITTIEAACSWLTDRAASLVILTRSVSEEKRQAISRCICDEPALAHLPILALPAHQNQTHSPVNPIHEGES